MYKFICSTDVTTAIRSGWLRSTGHVILMRDLEIKALYSLKGMSTTKLEDNIKMGIEEIGGCELS
jgi:hypothetical protein